jgi:hypothetical protein
VGIAAAIAATSNRGGTLGLRTRAPGDYANHCKGGPSRLLHRRRRGPIPAAGSAFVDHPPPAGPPAGGGAPWRNQRGDAVRPPADRRCLPAPRCAHPARGDGRAGNIPALLLYPAARGQRRRLEGVIASEDMRQLLAMEARCRRYMWITSPITSVHDEPTYREPTGAAYI